MMIYRSVGQLLSDAGGLRLRTSMTVSLLYPVPRHMPSIPNRDTEVLTSGLSTLRSKGVKWCETRGSPAAPGERH